MGAKGSTASGGHQSPRTRTFSTSSSTDVVSAAAAPGFNLLRTLPGVHVQQSDRQRARSLSAVPDLQTNSNNNNSHHNHHGSNNHNHNHDNESGLSTNQRHNEEQMYGEHNRNNRDNAASIDGNQVTSATGSSANAAANALALGRVYTATSLPSHIWSLNGLKCPVCSKFILPDDIECHLVMCLTKPRLSYNEDVLVDAKGECVICLEELNPGDIIARLPCLCIYHKGCIDRWFEVNRCCPEHPGD